MMKVDFVGLEQLAVKGQKKSKYLPPPPPPTFQPQQSQSKNPFIWKKVEQVQFKKWPNYIAVFCTLEFTLITAYNHFGLTLNFAWPYLDYNVTFLTAHEQHGLGKVVVMATLVHQAPVITVGGGRILPKKSNYIQHKPNWVLSF